jgi:hypothetical protein
MTFSWLDGPRITQRIEGGRITLQLSARVGYLYVERYEYHDSWKFYKFPRKSKPTTHGW